MKELDDFTVERLQAFIDKPLDNGFTRDEQMLLARIALAAKTAELVAFRVGDRLFSSLYSAGCYSSEMKLKIEPLYLDAQPNSPAIPDGWKLAPIEPTESMVIDGFESEAFNALADAVLDKKGWPYSCRESAECVTGIFKSMLDAAPPPPTTEK